MRRVSPGPERDAAIQRMRVQWAGQEAALRRAPFSIFGLTPPSPSPARLGSLETENGQVTSVGLQYGEYGPSPNSRVTVCTAPASANRDSRPVADVLRGLLTEHEDADQPQPSGGGPEVAEIVIDGVPRPAHILISGQSWAAVAETDVAGVALLVTVAARGWPSAGLALTRVDDLEPFFAERRDRVEAALARASTQPGPEDWDLPAASGLEGHRALAEMMIATSRESLLRRSPLPANYGQRWEVATRAQMALAGQGRDEAEDEVHSMVNHLCQLAQEATWFANPALADKAIAETLDYFAYHRDVASSEAQRAWSSYWALHGQQPPAFETLSSAQQSWLAAWERWVERR